MIFHKIDITRENVAHLIFCERAFGLLAQIPDLLFLLERNVIQVIVIVPDPKLFSCSRKTLML